MKEMIIINLPLEGILITNKPKKKIFSIDGIEKEIDTIIDRLSKYQFLNKDTIISEIDHIMSGYCLEDLPKVLITSKYIDIEKKFIFINIFIDIFLIRKDIFTSAILLNFE